MPRDTSSAPNDPNGRLGPEPGWESCAPLAGLPSMRNFVGDDPAGERIQIRYYRDSAEPTALKAKVWFGPGAEGPPAHAHGGALMATLDEVLGGSVWLAGRTVVLAHFETDMRRPVPLGTVVIVEGRITGSDGRKVYAAGCVRGLDGAVFTEATGLFVEIDAEALARLGGNRP